MVKDAVKDIREAFFPADDGSFPVTPKGFESTVPVAKGVIKQVQEKCSGSRRRGLLLGCHSLAASLDSDIPPAEGVVCDLLLISRDIGLHVLTITDTEDHGQITHYSHAAAQALKRDLVLKGGCKEKFCVSYHVVPCSATAVDVPNGDNRYPKSYSMAFTREKLTNILDALVIILSKVPSTLSTKLGVSFLHLLTKEQFLLVKQKINEHREYWIQGAAGTGKSLVAVEFMRELRRRDKSLKKEEILYVCENSGMRAQTERADVCQSVCRKTFMEERFLEVKHVIFDEAQSFKDDKGNWLRKARMLVRQHSDNQSSEVGTGVESEMESGAEPESLESGSEFQESPGYLWIFIGNEQRSQRCLRYKTGFPRLYVQKPYCRLKKVIRNSKRIYHFSKKFLEERARKIEIGHDFEGEKVDEIKSVPEELEGKEQDEILNSFLAAMPYFPGDKLLETLNEVLQSLLQKGYSEGEIAILFEDEGSIPESSILLSQLNLEKIVNAEENHSQDVVGSSISKYSGLERPVVILVARQSSDFHSFTSVLYEYLALRYCAVTRAMVKLIVLYGCEFNDAVNELILGIYSR